MISIETTQAFLASLSKDKDNNAALKLLADFVIKEPNLMAFTAVCIGSNVFQNPVTAAMIALSIYEKMRTSQQEADDLRKSTS